LLRGGMTMSVKATCDAVIDCASSNASPG